MRHIEHSDEFTDAVSESRVELLASFFGFCRARSCLCVFLLLTSLAPLHHNIHPLKIVVIVVVNHILEII
jgi:hypothetical protein